MLVSGLLSGRIDIHSRRRVQLRRRREVHLSSHRQPSKKQILGALDELDVPASGFGRARANLLRHLVENKIRGTQLDSAGLCKFYGWEPDPDRKARVRAKVADLRQALRTFYSRRGKTARVAFELPDWGWNPVWTFRDDRDASDQDRKSVV